MRTIVKDKQEFNVTEHIIVKNLWEYYILEDEERPDDLPEDIQFALVLGIETELGDVSMSEIAPYIITRIKDLSEIMPPVGWSWKWN